MYKNDTFNYSITRPIAVLSQRGTSRKELNFVSFNGSPSKLDIRNWEVTDLTRKMLKGVTLNQEEAAVLIAALKSIEGDDWQA